MGNQAMSMTRKEALLSLKSEYKHTGELWCMTYEHVGNEITKGFEYSTNISNTLRWLNTFITECIEIKETLEDIERRVYEAKRNGIT